MTLAAVSLIAAAAASQAAAPAPARHPAVDFFVSACIDGRADLAGSGAREVRWGALPTLIRNGMRSGDGLRFWEVPQPRLYLVVKAENPRDFYQRACSVYAHGVDVTQAHDQVWQVIWGEAPPPNREPGRPLIYEFSNLAEGYQFSVRVKTAGWVLMQIGHVGEAGRRRFEEDARHPHPRAVRRRVPTGARP